MPEITVNGASLHYESAGGGAEAILFSHGLLMRGEMFAAQVAQLSPRYRCIAYDHRGQGRSEVTTGGYDMDSLAADAAALIEKLGIAPVHFVGLSMGGFVGLRLAARRPELLRSLVLLETSAAPEPADTIGRYRLLGFIGRWFGYGLVISRVMPIMFGKTFLTDPARAADRERWRAFLLGNDRVGIQRALAGVLARAGVEDELARISVRTLILVGDEDVATPPVRAERIRDGIAGAKLVVIPGAGHSSTIEQPAAVTAAIGEFLGA
jgi:pimeloyl-ACP methyl ester carboxylesterase